MRKIIYLGLVIGGFALVILAINPPQTTAQDDEAEYVGTRECASCHRDVFRLHDQTPHDLALVDVADDKEPILADFSTGEDIRTIQFPNEANPRPLTADDIIYVMGKGRYVQRYVYDFDGSYRVLPVEWNTVQQEWLPYELSEGDWLTDPAYDWGANCAACHTTAYNPQRISWEEDGVQCETCHGPGSLHVDAADEADISPTDEEARLIHETIVLSPDSQICGQCHSQGRSEAHPFPAAYIPGMNLLDPSVFTLVDTNAEGFWWTAVHGQQSNMQFNEWSLSAHANTPTTTLANVEGATDECLSCHSADYGWNAYLVSLHESDNRSGELPEAVTLTTAQYGVTCTSCHELHAEEPRDFLLENDTYTTCVMCHTDPDSADGLHHPNQQMFEGTTLIPEVSGVPSAHFSGEAGPDCVTCHMPRMPIGSFSLSSHALQIVSPSAAIESGVLTDTCSTCHEEQASAVALQQLIDDTQNGTRARWEAAMAALTGNEPAWVKLALDFIAGDGSLGIHNYAYTDALLDAIEAELDLNAEDNTNAE